MSMASETNLEENASSNRNTTQTDQPQSSGFPFLDLPGEIRNRIYEYVVEDKVVDIEHEPASKEIFDLAMRCVPDVDYPTTPAVNPQSHKYASTDIALLLVCQRVYKEVEPLIYPHTVFSIELWAFQKYLRDLNTPVFWSRIRHLSVHLNLYRHMTLSAALPAIIIPLVDRFDTVTFHRTVTPPRVNDEEEADALIPDTPPLLSDMIDSWRATPGQGYDRRFEAYQELVKDSSTTAKGFLELWARITVFTKMKKRNEWPVLPAVMDRYHSATWNMRFASHDVEVKAWMKLIE